MARRPNTLPEAVPTARVALYLRYSSEEQGDAAYSTIDAQRECLRGYAAERGLSIVAEYRDEARTGTNLKRAGYRALHAAAKRGEFDAVLVTFMDRLGRGETFTIARYQLGEAGVSVVTAMQEFGSGTVGYIGRSARQMFDGMYPEVVKEWTERKILAMLASGYHCAGRAPFGYVAIPVEGLSLDSGKRPPKRLVPEERAAEIVREAYRRAADGEGKAAILRYVSGATGEAWNFDRISRLLASRVYRGIASWGKHTNEAAHIPIVDAELWQEAQDALALLYSDPVARGAGTQGRDTAYYLRGRVVCSCGRNMTPSWSRGHTGDKFRYYQCYGYRDRVCQSQGGVGQVSAAKLHEAVFVEAFALAKVPWRLRGVLEEARRRMPDHRAEAAGDLRRLRRDVERLTRERDRYADAIRVSPSAALPTLTRGMGEAETALTAARTALHGAEEAAQHSQRSLPTFEQCQALLSRLGELWSAATQEERQEIAALMIERVTVESKDKAIARYRFLSDTGPDLRGLRGEVRNLDEVKGRSHVSTLNQSSPNPGKVLPAFAELPLSIPRRVRAGDANP